MSNNDIETIHSLLTVIWEQLNANEKALKENTPFQTDGLEDKVKDICEKVTSLPSEQALTFEPELNKIIDFLTTLSEQMKVQQDLLKEESKALNQREKAMNAYKKKSASMPKKPSDKK